MWNPNRHGRIPLAQLPPKYTVPAKLPDPGTLYGSDALHEIRKALKAGPSLKHHSRRDLDLD